MIKEGTSEEEYVKMRRERDASLRSPRYLHPSLQVSFTSALFLWMSLSHGTMNIRPICEVVISLKPRRALPAMRVVSSRYLFVLKSSNN